MESFPNLVIDKKLEIIYNRVMVRLVTKEGKYPCKMCRVYKLPSEFTLRKDGLPRTYCKDCVRIRNQNRVAADPGYLLRRRYLITQEEFDQLLASQDNKCAICFDKLLPKGLRASSITVDHEHGTTKVRGLLCRNCNVGLGHFKDDPIRLANAIRYLRIDK